MEQNRTIISPPQHTVAPERANVGDTERVASTIGGGAMLVYGIAQKSWGGAALALAGSYLAFRGLTGHCPAYKAAGISTAEESNSTVDRLLGAKGIEVRRSVTIARPAEEVYAYWRDFSNLPHFMKNVESVQKLSDTLSHWVVQAPLGTTVEWDAEVINDHPGEIIAWQSRDYSDIAHAGLVRFRATDQGTVVEVRISYRAPFRQLGAMLAKLIGEDPSQQIQGDLRRLKQLMETGELISTEGQPSGRQRK